MKKTTCRVSITCPSCGSILKIIGDPASEQELLRLYFSKGPRCLNCGSIIDRNGIVLE